MRILIVTPYIFNQEYSEFTNNHTGFGIMVNDIFNSVSEMADTYLLSHIFTRGHDHVLKHTWLDVFKNSNLKDWIKGLKYFVIYKQSIKGRAKYLYYALNAGTLRSAIKKIKPDVVHIHGIGVRMKPFVDICNEMNIPFVVTLHGLIGLDPSVHAPKWDKDMERDFLISSQKSGVQVTVISSGMKHRIEEHYLHQKANTIKVICNGTRIQSHEACYGHSQFDLRKNFGIGEEKIVVVIGSVCERKNQIQIIRAIKTGIVKTPCHVFLCGTDSTNGMIKRETVKYGLENRIHLLGFLPRIMIDQLLEQADLNVVASKDEGFGLSIIEAYSHGVPTVTFSDLDAIPDVYDEKAMIRVNSRSDEDLAQGIEEGLIRKWNSTDIKRFANSFSLELMAENYLKIYQSIMMTDKE